MSLDMRVGAMLSRGAPGSGSNYGGMCDRLEMMATAGCHCGKCGGLGFVEVPESELQRWRQRIASAKNDDDRERLRDGLSNAATCGVCGGTGFVRRRKVTTGPDRELPPPDSMFTTVWCRKCKGCGETFPPTDESAEREDRCPDCDGEGCLQPLTVRPTGSSKHGNQPRSVPGGDDEGESTAGGARSVEWLDESQLSEYGRMSSVMLELRRTHPTSADALEAHHGSEGDRWGKTRWGRLFALWPLTKHGRKLFELGLDRSDESQRQRLNPLDVIASEREAEDRAVQPNQRRRHFIRKADTEARNLWRQAQQALREVAKQ